MARYLPEVSSFSLINVFRLFLNIYPFVGIDEESESEEESEEEKQNDEEAKEEEEEEEGKKTPVQMEKKKKKGKKKVTTRTVEWSILKYVSNVCVWVVRFMFLCFTDSSGESDSSDDSDIEGETASALFMAVSVRNWTNSHLFLFKPN